MTAQILEVQKNCPVINTIGGNVTVDTHVMIVVVVCPQIVCSKVNDCKCTIDTSYS